MYTKWEKRFANSEVWRRAINQLRQSLFIKLEERAPQAADATHLTLYNSERGEFLLLKLPKNFHF